MITVLLAESTHLAVRSLREGTEWAGLPGLRGIRVSHEEARSMRALAKAIARDIRESSGGLPRVKALGLFLQHRGRAQVSMNLTDFRITPMHVVFERVEQAARRSGSRIHDSEIIGLVPREALAAAAPHVPFLSERHAQQILEDRIGI